MRSGGVPEFLTDLSWFQPTLRSRFHVGFMSSRGIQAGLPEAKFERRRGKPMARDSQAALVALNRFGLGARGGASGDFVNAASDPRGFVKAELGRPNGVLLEVPGLLSTAALGKAVFDYQFEIKQARDAASKSAPPAAPAATDAKGQRRNLSLNSIAMDITAKEPPAKPPENANAAMANPSATSAETMQPNAPKPPPPLNI